MNFRLNIIALFIAALIIFFPLQKGIADESEISTPEYQLLDLINNARQNPMDMVQALGFSPELILEQFPDEAEKLRAGLEPLRWNDKLYVTAQRHSEDMLANKYYSHGSPDGESFEDRIVSGGYPAVISNEALGMIAFSNFISSPEAASLIFENMLRDELGSSGRGLAILSPDIDEVGIGFGNGQWVMDGRSFNVYLATCDFGKKIASDLELEILDLINQIRENPLAYANQLGIDTDHLLQDLPELNDIFMYGLSPLSFNSKLFDSAKNHALDMLENNYLSEISPDGLTVEDRNREAGYDPIACGEIMRLLVTTDWIDPAEAARIHAERLFRRELNPECPQRNILNPEMVDAGICVLVTTPDGDDVFESNNPYYNILLVGDFGVR